MPRALIRRAAVLVGILGTSLSCGGERPAPAPPQGVLLITIDTLRADQLGAYGAAVRTPNLDDLAGQGVLFEEAITTAPWTLPSFASLLTGEYPHEHGAVGGSHTVLDGSHETLAERLAAAGLETAAFVAAEWLRSDFGLDQGFALYDDSFEGASRPVPAYQDRIIRWIEDHRDRPFFLWVHYFTPHTPYRPGPRFDRIYYEGDETSSDHRSIEELWQSLDRLPPGHRDAYGWLEGVTDIRFPIAQYQALVTESDHYVGELLHTLRRVGRWDDTLVIATSDHGEHLGEHGLYFLHLELYREVLRVPLIVSYPGGIDGGRRIGALVQTIDVFPTVTDYLGLPAGEISGVSLRPLVEERARAVRPMALSEWGGTDENLDRALQTEGWKLIYRRRGDTVRHELYRLASDPAEQHDLSPEYPVLVDRLSELLGPVRTSAVLGESPTRELAPATIERLRSLGYLR